MTSLSAVTVARLKRGTHCEELLDYFVRAFKDYLAYLRNFSARSVASSTNTNSPSLFKRETKFEQNRVVSTLKDLTHFVSSDQFVALTGKVHSRGEELAADEEMAMDTSCTSESHVTKTSQLIESIHSLLKSLLCLLDSNTYPNGYPIGNEYECSLTVLVSWSSSTPRNLKLFASEIPFASLLKQSCSVSSMKMSLSLIINLCVYKDLLPLFTHQNDDCVLCSIALLVFQNISSSPLEYIDVMLSVEDLISTCITLHSLIELKLDSSPCSVLIVQAIICPLWKFYDLYEKEAKCTELVLQKGFTLLHLLSRYYPNFKDLHSNFEDTYILLVCGMLSLSKDNHSFKNIYDLVHDLWDFQEDSSEFDKDDATEDSSYLT